MATTLLRNVLRCHKDMTRGICLINCVKTRRPFATVLNVELDQETSVKKNNLLDVYHKKRINDENAMDKLGHTKLKSFEEILKEEKKKIVVRFTETEVKKDVWSEKSRRAGAVGMKIGMSLLWRKNGRPVRVTLIQVERSPILYCYIAQDLSYGGNVLLLFYLSNEYVQASERSFSTSSYLCTKLLPLAYRRASFAKVVIWNLCLILCSLCAWCHKHVLRMYGREYDKNGNAKFKNLALPSKNG